MPFHGLGRLAPVVYLMIALPVIVFHALAMPPFQSADEDNHFLRMVALSRGGLVGIRFSDTSVGGFVDRAALEAAHRLDWLKFHPERRATAAAIAEERSLAWRPIQLVPADFGNTAIYPPWFYVPGTLAVLVARIGRLPVSDGLLLARLATGLAGAALGAWALWIAGQGRALIFAVLSLPMTLALLGSCSQDGLLIPAGALAAALLGRAREWRMACVAAGLILGMVVAARPPYAPLLGLILLALPAWGDRAGDGFPRRRLALVLAAMLLPLLWLPFGAVPVQVGMRPGDGVSIPGQLAGLVADPLRLPTVAMRTLLADGVAYWHQFIGVLGWLDTVLPQAPYAIAETMLAVALLVDLTAAPHARPLWVAHACLVLVLGALGAVATAQYLSWTPVGLPVIEGIQGRYAIPVALFLPLALPAMGTAGASWNRARNAGWGAAYLAASASLWFVPMAIMARYYG